MFKKEVENKMITLNQMCENDTSRSNPFHVIDVETVCKKLKLGKAGGADGLTYENLKYGNTLLYKVLTLLYNMIMKYEFIPVKCGLIITFSSHLFTIVLLVFRAQHGGL